MKRFMAILFLFLSTPTWIASAELTKAEMKEIQGIMRQELQYMDKRFDDMNKRFDDMLNFVNKRFDDMNNRFNDMNNRINDRIDDVNKSINGRIDDTNNILLWGFGVLFAGMFVLVGFVIWDRRTASDKEEQGVRREAGTDREGA